VRKEDLVYRYGGDEFVVVAPVSDEDEARALAGRLQRSVHENTETRVSVGYAVAASDASDLTEALRHADRALLDAKRRGRGLVVGGERGGSGSSAAGQPEQTAPVGRQAEQA
jgi:diguanylate cyclase